MTVVLSNIAGNTRKAAPSPAVVRVNGVVISRDAIAREIQNHPAHKPAAAWQDAARG